MNKKHTYTIAMNWTGNLGEDTKTYAGYKRADIISSDGKPNLEVSSDPHFKGDGTR